MGLGQKTSTISVSERHHYWASARFELERSAAHLAQSLTWMLLVGGFSIVFSSLWGLARAEHPRAALAYTPPFHIHVVLHGHGDVHDFGARYALFYAALIQRAFGIASGRRDIIKHPYKTSVRSGRFPS